MAFTWELIQKLLLKLGVYGNILKYIGGFSVQNNENQKPAQKSFFVRNIIMILVIALTLSLMVYFISSNRNGKEIYPSTFITQLNEGNVQRVDFTNNKVYVTYKDNTKVWFYNRSEDKINEIVLAYNETNEQDASKQIVISYGSTTTFSVLNIIYPVLMFASVILLAVFIMRSIKNANKGSLDFVKNRARIAQSNVRFSDVAGIDEEKEELSEIVEFLKDPSKFAQMGARVPKGVLLVGRPGTGKTLLAKAIAGEAGVPFFTISGSDFMELFVGVGASRVRDLFETAKKAKPCIIFIDEIDAIGRQRGTGMGGGNDEREQTLNQMLVQMDGFEPNEGMIVIAATNRVDILDPALLRPGRFDRQIHVPIPDVKGREAILKVHSKNKPLDASLDLQQVARITSGFTGADIENLLNEAAILAVRKHQKTIDMICINDAIQKVTLGPQKKSRVMTDSDKYLTAVHEAGHAIVCKNLQKNVTVHEVSIIPRGYAGGYTQMRPTDDSTYQKKSDLLNDIAVALGGRMAEKLYLDDISTGASGDLEQATKIARAMVVTFGMSEEVGLVHLGGNDNEFFLGRDYQSRLNYSEKEAALIDAEIRKLINSAQTMAEKVLTKHKKALHVLVDCLLEKETVYADEIDQIMQGKTKEEVLAYIEQKTAHKESLDEDKKENKNETSDKQNKTKTQTTATSIKATTEERERDRGAKAEEKGIEENKKQTLGEDEKRSETKKSVKKSNATTKKTSGTSARKTTKKQAQRSTKNAKLDTKEDAE